MKISNYCTMLAISIVASALAVPPALSAEGRKAPVTLPSPPEGQGQVIFWRSESMMGGGMGCGVNIGTERISALGTGKYFILNLAPGTYEFNAKSESKDILTLEVDPGETYYVKCTIRMGVMVGRPNLSPSTVDEFNKGKDGYKYVDSDDIGPKVLLDPGAVEP